ncbi:MAG: YCF48-related protein [Ignavibacteria bacterium]
MFIKIIFLLTFANLQLQTLNSQPGWFTQPSGTHRFLWNAYFIDTHTGYAVGDFGTIIKTTNGGDNWTLQNSPVSNNLIGVNFINSETGWISGHQGVALKTTNGGHLWSVQNSATNRNLFFVKFANSHSGWISSDEGILNTTNGGANWMTQFHSNVGIYSLFFYDSQLGWFAERLGNIYKTYDGGNTWTFTQNIPNSSGVWFDFINQHTGWSVGYENKILMTTSGGNHWLEQTSGAIGHQQLRCVDFSDSSDHTGWIAGFENTLMRTNNGGLNWIRQNTPVNTDYTYIQFVTSLTGWAVGGNGTIIKTISGGDITSIEPSANNLSDNYSLSQNYPNPFNPTTKINYSIPNTQYTILKVYNILGNEIAILVNEKQNAGSYSVVFDGSNYPSGIYYYKLVVDSFGESGEFNEVRKMILIK